MILKTLTINCYGNWHQRDLNMSSSPPLVNKEGQSWSSHIPNVENVSFAENCVQGRKVKKKLARRSPPESFK